MLTNLKLTTLFLSSHFAVAALAGRCKPDPPPFSTFPRRIIYDPPAGKRASYPRHVELKDGTLLVTSSIIGGDFFGGSNSSFPVFESKDGGVHWKWISNITDQVNGWGMSAQPALLELQKPLGGFKAGTISSRETAGAKTAPASTCTPAPTRRAPGSSSAT